MGEFLSEIDVRKRRLQDLKQRFRGLQTDESTTNAELKWFRNFDKGATENRVMKLTRELHRLAPLLQSAETERSRIAENLFDESQRKTSSFLIWNYFSDEQRLIREQIRQLKQEKVLADKNCHELKSDIDTKSIDRQKLVQQLQEYAAFNCEVRKAKLNQLSVDITKVQSEIRSKEREFANLENAISPQLAEWDKICSEIKKLEHDELEAKRFDRELNNANNSYERAMIHKECEEVLGHSKPRFVIRDRSTKISGLKRKRQKIEKRIEGKLRILTRQVTNLIIDGNNACYDGQNFIGLAAIRAMLEELGSRYDLTVVFDADIRAMLKTNDQGISDALGNGVRTYVSPTRTKADEYILEFANQKEDTYIFSNDRYSEYRDYEAVKSERLIRFMIAQGRIISHEINLSAEFKY
ncbi:MAG: hypothetical protein OXN84_03145 [Albidovulum sp.]|nr:hypothetical protein [Albidovulum sp.]